LELYDTNMTSGAEITVFLFFITVISMSHLIHRVALRL
jgi:hypothetical protein